MPYWSEALNVTSRFIFWYLVLPGLIAARLDIKAGRLDRLALGFMVSVASTVAIAQTLSAMRLFEPLTLWGLLAVAGTAWLAHRGRREPSWKRLWILTLDRVEEERWGLVSRLASRAAGRTARGLRSWPSAIRHPDLTIWLIGAAVLAWSAWLRYFPYLQHAFLGAYDGYVHLAWVKYLETNQLFRDGVYPYGYHAVLAVLGSLNFIDRLLVLRFAGPIGGTLIVASVAYAAHKFGFRPAAAVAATALIGLGVSSPLPTSAFRQAQPLPQEFAAVFVLPGAACAWHYLRTGDRISGWLAILAAFLTASIHAYASVYLAAALAVMALTGTIARCFPPARVVRLALTSGAAVLLGVLPLIAARLSGMDWHQSSIEYVAGQISAPGSKPWADLFSGNPFLDGGLILGAVLILNGKITAARGKRDRAALALATGVILILLFTQAHGQTGLPVLVDPARSGLFFSLFLALAAGLALDLVWAGLKAERCLQTVTAVALIAALVTVWWPKPPGAIQLEYDEAVDAYLDISRTLNRKTWHIVSPAEQYSQVLGQGYHEQLGHFLRRVTADQVRRPGFKLYLPSPDVFVYVEKWPLGSPESVKPEAEAPLALGDLVQPKILEDYYRDPARRSLMESRVWGIMEAYREAHPDQISVYRDSPRFRVYHIKHNPVAGQKTEP